MSSTEFFTLVKEHLNENGVMVVNMNMRGTEEGNINQYLATGWTGGRTEQSVIACLQSDRYGKVIKWHHFMKYAG